MSVIVFGSINIDLVAKTHRLPIPGETFNGALAAAIAAGKPLRQAVIWGAAAGALCATKAGAQPSLPDRQEFEAFLRERGVEF